jgi:hypothetical protein
MALDFTIKIPCKPYIRKYLVNNFGSKPDLKADPVLYHFFLRLLDRNLKMQENRIDLSQYKSNITISYTHNVFKHIGFNLNKTDIKSFNQLVEAYIKKQMVLKIDTHLKYNDNLAACIRTIQEEFSFSEDDFQFESIKKYYVRNSKFYTIFCLTSVPKNLTSVPNNNQD